MNKATVESKRWREIEGKLSGNWLMWWKTFWHIERKNKKKNYWKKLEAWILETFFFPFPFSSFNFQRLTAMSHGTEINLLLEQHIQPHPLMMYKPSSIMLRHLKYATAMLHIPQFIILRSWQIEWIFIMKWKFLFISLPFNLPTLPNLLMKVTSSYHHLEFNNGMCFVAWCNKSADLSISTRILHLIFHPHLKRFCNEAETQHHILASIHRR